VAANSEEQARRAFESFRLMAHTGETAVINGDVESGEWRRGSVRVTITGPRQQELVKISTDGGDAAVNHLKGRAEVDTGGGSVSVDDIGGDAKLSSGGGNAHVGTVKGDLHLRSGGGNVDIANVGSSAVVESGGGNISVGTIGGDLAITTGGGSIVVKQVAGDMAAETGGGSLDLGRVGGDVSAETGGGSIRLTSGKEVTAQTGAGSIQCMNVKRGLKAETGSGGITAEFTGGRNDIGESRLDAGVGDIVVYLPADAAVNVRALIDVANGHNIQSDFSAIKVTESESYGPREVYAEGKLNGGGPTLKIHTTSGNISLRTLKKIVSSEEDNSQ
jgi:DUF4097 and DUF4098 domain-containing protein YvlB